MQDWNAHALAATNAQNPFLQARSIAIVQLAVFEAVNAVAGDHEPYLGTISASVGSSVDAAAIEAAYRALWRQSLDHAVTPEHSADALVFEVQRDH